MRNKLLVRLCLNLMAIFMICSCRTDQFSEHETYSDSPTFHLTTKRISLDASKHKTKILPELEKAKAGIRAFSKVNVNGKIINYGNGVSIDTDDVIYIENGPNYHTYTFHIKRDNAPEDVPLENLLLSPLPDGSYRELLITYTLTSTEKERLKAGLMVDTKGKTQVTELANGTFNGSGQLARLVCTTKTESYWAPCSGTQQHNGSNYESCPIYNGLEQGTPPILYTIVTTTCLEQNDDIITPIDPGTGGGGGGSTGGGENPHDPPCDTSIIPSNPESGFTDENGCPIGTPTIPNLPDPKTDPCKRTKAAMSKANDILNNAEVKTKMDNVLKGKITAPNEWVVAIGQAPNGYEVTPAAEQNATNGTIPSSQLTNPYIADGHSHAGYSGVPSGGDFYKMIKALTDSPALRYRYVYGNYEGTPEVYALVIDDPTLAQAFIAQFPESENYDPSNRSIKEESPLGREFYKAHKHHFEGRSDNSSGEVYDSRAIGFAYIFEKHNAGISISKTDANGNLKKINANVQEITVPNSGGIVKEGVKVSKCP
ncbi:MAG: hypothetical protein P0Y62_09625 [Candidatus Chryseobacterium colombiense]|nr:hypothetical protein [Chryseobacterium sp.]WEK68133.1 MAG: hypothetical protein P0Y62_09625 [Chryseobacterium sp.]